MLRHSSGSRCYTFRIGVPAAVRLPPYSLYALSRWHRGYWCRSSMWCSGHIGMSRSHRRRCAANAACRLLRSSALFCSDSFLKMTWSVVFIVSCFPFSICRVPDARCAAARAWRSQRTLPGRSLQDSPHICRAVPACRCRRR